MRTVVHAQRRPIEDVSRMVDDEGQSRKNRSSEKQGTLNSDLVAVVY